jgi:uncharacterized membrane protein
MRDHLALLLAALLWIGLHRGVAGTGLRGHLVGAIGENRFRLLFSVASAVAIVLLAQAWGATPTEPLWRLPAWLGWLPAALMLPAFVLFAGSVMAPNPTMVGGGRAATGPLGVLRATRHPMLWSFALWAAAHVLANGDTAALILFGTFLLTALSGMPSIDRKLAARDPDGFAALAAATSLLPNPARLRPGEMAVPTAVGTLAWAATAYLHAPLFGVPAWMG